MEGGQSIRILFEGAQRNKIMILGYASTKRLRTPAVMELKVLLKTIIPFNNTLKNESYFLKIKDQRQKLINIFDHFLLFPPIFWLEQIQKQTLKK
jgi:hypothetical protein